MLKVRFFRHIGGDLLKVDEMPGGNNVTECRNFAYERHSTRYYDAFQIIRVNQKTTTEFPVCYFPKQKTKTVAVFGREWDYRSGPRPSFAQFVELQGDNGACVFHALLTRESDGSLKLVLSDETGAEYQVSVNCETRRSFNKDTAERLVLDSIFADRFTIYQFFNNQIQYPQQ